MVSVCIANFNGMEVINDCLRSVLEQEGHIPIEILIHDDASSDGSATHIRNVYPGVRLIASQENVGFCIANNRMAAEAKGKYLLLLNNDAALYPNAIHTLLTEAVRLDQPAILGLPQYDAASGELIDQGCLLDPFFNPVPNLDRKRLEVAMVIGACLWLPKALWDELGGFPEWFGSIAEDMYLCCRARLAGYPVRCIDNAGYRHWVGASFGGGKPQQGRLSTSIRRRALSELNKTYVMITFQPWQLLLVLLPLHLLLIHLEGLLLAVVKRTEGLWREIYAPILPTLWRNQRRLRSERSSQPKRLIRLSEWVSHFHWIPWKLRALIRYGIPVVK